MWNHKNIMLDCDLVYTLALNTLVAKSVAAKPIPLTPTFIKIISSSLIDACLSRAIKAVI